MQKHILFCFLFSVVLIFDARPQAFEFEDYSETPGKSTLNIHSGSTQGTEKELINFAKKYLGVPYKYAGKTPLGFDCSGFVGFVFKEFGVSLPASSGEIAKVGVAVDKKDLKIGDLLFFEGRKQTKTVGHVGIVAEINDKDVYFIHAAVWSGGIIISGLEEQYYASRYLLAKRVKIDQGTRSNFEYYHSGFNPITFLFLFALKMLILSHTK